MRRKTKLKRDLRNGLGQRLKTLREGMKLSRNQFAGMLNRTRTTFQRNEEGDSFPEYSTLFKLSEKFDVSIDWLLCNKGPMYYKEKQADPNPMENHNCMDSLKEEYRELLTYMEEIPVLRYEILLSFRKYLEEHNLQAAAAAPGKAGEANNRQ
ncbi:MAG: helix-turn-helix transcriptional regulator [bacterium]|nr:helix-turn-helix transcriptional regulator [bacterium]